jgi:hypothetical protein
MLGAEGITDATKCDFKRKLHESASGRALSLLYSGEQEELTK